MCVDILSIYSILCVSWCKCMWMEVGGWWCGVTDLRPLPSTSPPPSPPPSPVRASAFHAQYILFCARVFVYCMYTSPLWLTHTKSILINNPTQSTSRRRGRPSSSTCTSSCPSPPSGSTSSSRHAITHCIFVIYKYNIHARTHALYI